MTHDRLLCFAAGAAALFARPSAGACDGRYTAPFLLRTNAHSFHYGQRLRGTHRNARQAYAPAGQGGTHYGRRAGRRAAAAGDGGGRA